MIWKVLYPVFVKLPSSEDEWKGISDVFLSSGIILTALVLLTVNM